MTDEEISFVRSFVHSFMGYRVSTTVSDHMSLESACRRRRKAKEKMILTQIPNPMPRHRLACHPPLHTSPIIFPPWFSFFDPLPPSLTTVYFHFYLFIDFRFSEISSMTWSHPLNRQM